VSSTDEAGDQHGLAADTVGEPDNIGAAISWESENEASSSPIMAGEAAYRSA
jgi:hypothetical protein